MIWTIINACTVNLERRLRESKQAQVIAGAPGKWPAPFLITRSFYPLLFLITRSFYPLPAPNRYSLQIDIWLIITFVKRTYIVQ
jgi:hypothetical protein